MSLAVFTAIIIITVAKSENIDLFGVPFGSDTHVQKKRAPKLDKYKELKNSMRDNYGGKIKIHIHRYRPKPVEVAMYFCHWQCKESF